MSREFNRVNNFTRYFSTNDSFSNEILSRKDCSNAIFMQLNFNNITTAVYPSWKILIVSTMAKEEAQDTLNELNFIVIGIVFDGRKYYFT